MAVNTELQEEEEEIERRTNENQSENAERWIKYYSSFQEILLVGDGDFSFSLCLAKSFGSASNIVATCLDQYDMVIAKYKNAKSNLENLERLGATLMHGVDVTKMKLLPDLKMRKFDRIIYNFPHAGFYGKEDQDHLIRMHRNLVQSFFRNASGMLRSFGEVHVNHKMTPPFNNWNLEELASKHNLQLIECVKFKKEDYPGYCNKRGAGPKCDEPFPLGKCCTFKFVFSRNVKKTQQTTVEYIRTRRYQTQRIPLQTQNPSPFEISYPTGLPQVQRIPPPTQNSTLSPTGVPKFRGIPSQAQNPTPIGIRYSTEIPQVQGTPSQAQYPTPIGSYLAGVHPVRMLPPQTQRPTPFGVDYPTEIPQVRRTASQTQSPTPFDISYRWRDFTTSTSHNFGSVDSPFTPAVSEECSRIFNGYFMDAVKMFGRSGYPVGQVVHGILRTGFDRYMVEAPGRTVNGYIRHLEELHRFSILRSEGLQRMLNNIKKEKIE